MASPERIYHGSVRVLSAVFIVLGLAIVVLTVAAGGGPLSIGLLMGLAFVAVGAGRLYLAGRLNG